MLFLLLLSVNAHDELSIMHTRLHLVQKTYLCKIPISCDYVSFNLCSNPSCGCYNYTTYTELYDSYITNIIYDVDKLQSKIMYDKERIYYLEENYSKDNHARVLEIIYDIKNKTNTLISTIINKESTLRKVIYYCYVL
jgi:hypothetical protein